MWLATVLLVPTGALCVANGVRGLMAADRDRRRPPGAGRLRRRSTTVVLAWFCRQHLPAGTTEQLPRRTTTPRCSLNLPGSHDMRLGAAGRCQIRRDHQGRSGNNCSHDPDGAGDGQLLPVGASRNRRPTRRPPGRSLFDDEQQEKVIEDTRSIKRPLPSAQQRNAGAVGDARKGMLTRYLEQGFKPIGRRRRLRTAAADGPYKGSL